ncbi:MAG: hypothetical protein V1739_02045 [Candidatus Omnitrophota bacterium]
MFVGALFILTGILIALNPPLLSFIAASILILPGLGFMSISYHYKKISKQFEGPSMDFLSHSSLG